MKHVPMSVTVVALVLLSGCCWLCPPQCPEPKVLVKANEYIEFVSPDDTTFGFVGADGSPIPSFVRNQPIILSVDDGVWRWLESVTLTNFRAFSGPPWTSSREDWDGITLELTEARETPVDFVLPTSYSGGHRLIKFDVTVIFDDGREFTYVDPWDEKPDGP